MAELIYKNEILTRIRLNYNNYQNVSAGVIKDMIDTTSTTTEADIRAKAIDEFAEKLKELFKYESAWGETQYYQRLVIDISKIDEIAEQLKGE